jgi:fucose 4-O-acetylase-like acetyltransferase
MERNRYADLLRVLAIGGVVYGHWLLVSVTYRDGQLSGVDALTYVQWGRWVTWAFQVMPLFFLVGGYVNARSWTAHHAAGETWTVWVRDRVLRLLWPTAVYIVVAVAAVAVARAAGAPAAEVAEAGWLVALQLWFLPAYMVLIALTPAMLAAHRRWGFAVPAAMAVAAALVDIGVTGPHLHVIGYLNYLFVWGSIHQWGFAWQDGSLTSPRWRPYALAAGGGALLAGLVTSRSFEADMVGSGNTNPPSVALLAYAAAQAGLVLAAEPWASRLLSRDDRWRPVRRLNSVVMTVYLWHFVPAIVIAVAFYPADLLPQPTVGSGEWFALRLAWFALLTVVLVPLVIVVTQVQRPMIRLPAGLGRAGPWSAVLLLAGIVTSSVGLARLAIGGFAPGGRPPGLVLAAFAAGLVAALFTGRAPAEGTQGHGAPPDLPQQPRAIRPVLPAQVGAAAHVNDLPRDVARRRRGEEHDGGGDVRGGPGALIARLADETLPPLAGECPVEELAADSQAGGDRVGGNAARPEFRRHAGGPRFEGRLRGAVRPRAAPRRDRTHRYDPRVVGESRLERGSDQDGRQQVGIEIRPPLGGEAR